MAEREAGPHPSGDVAQLLGGKVASLGPRRNAIIADGMIRSRSHGDTAITVPLFDTFRHRIMPGDAWKH